MERFDGSALRRTRVRFRLTQAAMARELGVSRMTLVRWERERRELEKVVRLALAAWVHGVPAMGSVGRESDSEV